MNCIFIFALPQQGLSASEITGSLEVFILEHERTFGHVLNSLMDS
jgi:hypothetical protein